MKYSEITDQTTKGFFALLFKLASGTLETLLEKRKSGLSYDETRDLIITIGEGMYNLQKLNIAHRDMKPSNILYYRVQDNKIKFKLTDFGEVKLDVDSDAGGTLKGTPKYLSPEENFDYLSGLDKTYADFFKSDVYSMGLTIIYAILMKGPFDKEKNKEKKKNCQRTEELKYDPRLNDNGPFDQKINELIAEIVEKFKDEKTVNELKKLLKKSLEYNPENRINWKRFKRYAQRLNGEEINVNLASNIDLKEECMICVEKAKEIEKFKKIIDNKDKFIKILIERNSKLIDLLERERIKKESAEKTLNDFLEQVGKKQNQENKEIPEKMIKNSLLELKDIKINKEKNENVERKEEKEESEKQIELDLHANHEENVINKILKVKKCFFINYFKNL